MHTTAPTAVKIGYLGPKFSFSYCLAEKEYPDAELVDFSSFGDACAAIIANECDQALIPFYNTNGHDVIEAQKEILKHNSQVFVTDVYADHIEHHACSYGQISDIKQVISKSPVLKQISKWYNNEIPNDRQFVSVDSTSKAIELVSENPEPSKCAVGNIRAAEHYGVPVIQKNIENIPNITVFFLLSKRRPDYMDIESSVWAIKNCTFPDMDKLSEITEEFGCSITAASRYTMDGTTYAYFEIYAHRANMNMKSACSQIDSQFPNSIFLGGYNKKSIKKLVN